MTLKSVLFVSFTALVVLTVAAAMALVLATGLLHKTATTLDDAIESVRLGQGLEIALLSHDRATDRLERATTQAELRELLAESREHAASKQATALVETAGHRIEEYLASPPDSADSGRLFERAVESVQELVQANLERSSMEKAWAARWDRRANAFAAAIVVASVLGLAAVLLWLQTMMFGPARRVAETVRRLASGDRKTHAAEDGAIELRSISRHVNEMADALAREEKNRMAFLGGVAHDLRTPLGALKMAVGAIRSDEPLPNEASIRQTLSRVGRQIDRLDRMIWDFLDASRIEAGALELRLQPCDLRKVADAVVDLFRPVAPRHDIVLTLPEAPALSRCDPLRMEQVLTNLLSNAIKYSPRGGRVELSVSRQAGAIHVAVSDQGIGIPSADLKALFAPFRRSGTSPECIPGVGLGLFVSRRIVEAHGGSMDVESVPQRGSTFHVMLPRENGQGPN